MKWRDKQQVLELSEDMLFAEWLRVERLIAN